MSQKIEISVEQTECAITALINGTHQTVCTVGCEGVININHTRGDWDNLTPETAEILAQCLLKAVDVVRIFEKDEKLRVRAFGEPVTADKPGKFLVRLIRVINPKDDRAIRFLESDCFHVTGDYWLYDGDENILLDAVPYSEVIGDAESENYRDLNFGELINFVFKNYDVDLDEADRKNN